MTPTISQSMPVTCLRAYRRARTLRVAVQARWPAVTSSPTPGASPRSPRPPLLALLAGVVVGARHVPAEKRTVEAFTQAWERGDHRAMYALLSDAARRRTTLERLQRTYRQAAETLTLQRSGPAPSSATRRPGHPRDPHLRRAARAR